MYRHDAGRDAFEHVAQNGHEWPRKEGEADKVPIEGDNLRLWIELADSWQEEVGAHTYLLAQILERKTKVAGDCLSVIKIFYELPDFMSLHIQEIGPQFVAYMLRNVRDRTLTLEEELVNLQTRLREHNYERTVRYWYEWNYRVFRKRFPCTIEFVCSRKESNSQCFY